MEECMDQQNLVAVYSSRATADAARARLVSAGIPASDIRLSAEDAAATPRMSAEPQRETGFFDWLFGEAPAEHQTWYASNLREGRTALSVYVRGQDHDRVCDMLEEFDPVDMDSGNLAAAESPVGGTAAARAGSGGARAAGTGREQVIPVAKEELDVGKRQTERRYKIRTYVVERPVEEQVRLHDERVTVERRPVSGARSVGADGLEEREIDVVERHEEPVVAKKARADEEVVIHKEASDRTETVRDKVRETRVDVDRGGAAASGRPAADRAAAGDKPGLASTGAPPKPKG
jgi:stress response protein YsnF